MLLLKGTPWKQILLFALPLMLAKLLQQLYNTVDTIILGNFDSQNALAAVGACSYLTGLYIDISIGLALGVGVIISQAYGAQDQINLKKGAGVGSKFILITGLIFSIFSYLTCPYFLEHVIAIPNEILHSAIIYTKIYSLGLFFQFGFNVFSCILRGVGNSKSTFYILLITTIINIILDLIFVAVFHYGVVGVAIATFISQFMAMLICFLYMTKEYPVFNPEKRYWIIEKAQTIKILQNGIPLTIQALIVNIGFMILQHIANGFGVQMTASYAVSCRLELYMLVPIISILQAMSTFAGQNFGAKKIQRLKIGLKQTIVMNLILAGIIGSFCYLTAPHLISLFALQGKAFEYALSHVRLASIDVLLYAFYSPINGMCIGIGRGYVLSFISLVELSGRIFFAILLSGIIGAACVWWSEPFAWFIVIIGVYLYYEKVLKKEILI